MARAGPRSGAWRRRPGPAGAQLADSSLLTLDQLFSRPRTFSLRRSGRRNGSRAASTRPSNRGLAGQGPTSCAMTPPPAPARSSSRPRASSRQATRRPWRSRTTPSRRMAVHVLVFTNSRRVWRQRTRGDFWLVDLTDVGAGNSAGPANRHRSVMFAKFSPDGQRVAYVREHNLYAEELATPRITQLTSDGSRTIINGTFDWVYEEELNLRDGFRWSPDGDADRVLAARCGGRPRLRSDRRHGLAVLIRQACPVSQSRPGELGEPSGDCERRGRPDASGSTCPGTPATTTSRGWTGLGTPARSVRASQPVAGHARSHDRRRADRALRTIDTEHDSAWVDVDRRSPVAAWGHAIPVGERA